MAAHSTVVQEEPKSPLWLPFAGVALFAVGGIYWLLSAPLPRTDETAPPPPPSAIASEGANVPSGAASAPARPQTAPTLVATGAPAATVRPVVSARAPQHLLDMMKNRPH
jgi:hypothetical protein